MSKQPAVYILCSKPYGTLYTGVTSNLLKRISEHRDGILGGFTWQYGCKTLAYYEIHAEILAAIAREKQIKGGSRDKKIRLIESINPTWRDLFDDLL
ncbi:MAG: GIY-YIG nuclease family protein [Alphaproteobacteria bacterium]|jgi:predicted GIY-YIG superfamily endonuclease|nr:GIY-YIG nuclease family protein [Alphaproteobacteria bacterium]